MTVYEKLKKGFDELDIDYGQSENEGNKSITLEAKEQRIWMVFTCSFVFACFHFDKKAK